MERFFLIASLAILSGCQLTSLILADLYQEPEPIVTVAFEKKTSTNTVTMIKNAPPFGNLNSIC